MPPISFADARQAAGLPMLAAGLPSPEEGPVLVAPANAVALNAAPIAAMDTSAAEFVPQGLPKDVTARSLARAYSWRDGELRSLLTPVVDQGVCGCCWAVAATGCVNDRILVQRGYNPMLSFQELMLCMQECPLCNSCSVESALQYLRSNGMTSAITQAEGRTEAGLRKAMRAYAARASGRLPTGFGDKAHSAAHTGGGLTPHKPTSPGTDGPDCATFQQPTGRASRVQLSGRPQRSATLLSLQQAIHSGGPVACLVRIFRDFIVGSDPMRGKPFQETEGVYVHRHGETNYNVSPAANADLGAHAMVIVGWGVTPKGLKYWEVRNSWGVGWGDKGYCKIAMTDSRLGNASVGVDLGITETKANIRTHRYGNVWINVAQADVEKGRLYGAPLNAARLSLRLSWRSLALAATLLLLALALCTLGCNP